MSIFYNEEEFEQEEKASRRLMWILGIGAVLVAATLVGWELLKSNGLF